MLPTKVDPFIFKQIDPYSAQWFARLLSAKRVKKQKEVSRYDFGKSVNQS